MMNTPFTRFCVTRKRRIERADENQMTARMMIPCCQSALNGFWTLKGGRVMKNWSRLTTRTAVATMTRVPGHQAQKPAKKPQKAPRALFVQTEIEPAPGTM